MQGYFKNRRSLLVVIIIIFFIIMRIGVFGRSYPQKRLMMNIVKGTEYVLLINFGNVISHKLKCMEFALPYRFDVDGYHSMNLVPLTNKPRVMSFETRTPRALSDDGIRYDHIFMKNMVNRLMRNNCKGLLALSDCTVSLEQDYLKGYCNQQQLDIILPKLMKITPTHTTICR